LDVADRTSSGGKQMVIAEMLSQSNAFQEDLPYVEANEIGGHEFAFRTSIPAGSWRQVNQGVPYSKSTTAKSRVGIASLEDYSLVDRWLLESTGDIERARMLEDVAFMEGMGQTMTQTFFYGNSATNPAQFMGLAPFYNTVNTATAANAANVISGGGTGSSNTSLWRIGHSPRHMYAIYPRGSKAGLDSIDKSDTTPAFDSAGNRYEAFTMWFRQQAAYVPEDWRYGVRCANIDTTSAGLAGPNALDLFATMAEMVLMTPTASRQASGITETDAPDDPSPGVRFVWYCNRTVRHWMDVQAMRNRNVLLTLKDYDGRVCDTYRGDPIKVVDQIVNTEARVV
jgi:hypothetical protein